MRRSRSVVRRSGGGGGARAAARERSARRIQRGSRRLRYNALRKAAKRYINSLGDNQRLELRALPYYEALLRLHVEVTGRRKINLMRDILSA